MEKLNLNELSDKWNFDLTNGFDWSIDDAFELFTLLHSFCDWVLLPSLAASATRASPIHGPSEIQRNISMTHTHTVRWMQSEQLGRVCVPFAADVVCSMDNFCMSSMGKLNRKSELPNVVAKDFFTKWLLFAPVFASLDVPSTNWMDVLPVIKWQKLNERFERAAADATLTSTQFFLFIGHFFTIITECWLH